jgi:hypothetical protein
VKLAVGLALASCFLPALAHSQTPKVRVAVSRVRGNSSWGADTIQRSLSTALGGQVDLVDVSAFEDVQRKTTGGRGQPDRFSKEGFAAAGKEVGAAYVLTVEIVRTGYLYTAHALLVNTASAAIQMDFRSGYYRPPSEAADRGERIARTTLAKITTLEQAKVKPIAGAPPPPPPPPPEEHVIIAPEGGRDSDIFGDADIGDGSASGEREDEIFASGLDGPGGVEETERRLSDLDTKVKAGGRLFLRLNYFIIDANVGDTSALSSPNLLDVYLDARLNDRVRAYSQARVTHDFTVIQDPAFPNRLKTNAFLDQLWAKFDVAHTIYVTVGKQRIKWGVGRFWNPTDFLNPAARDPLAVFDERLGVNLIKLHLPIELLTWNFYAIATFDDANLIKRAGGAFRAEIVLGPAELTFSVNKRRGGPLRLGADLSAGVAFLDIRAEGALIHPTDRPYFEGGYNVTTDVPARVDRDDRWIPQGVLGAEMSVPYSDLGHVIIGVEYFYNGAGYTSSDLYPYLLSVDAAARVSCTGLECDAPAFQPLYMGRHYGAAYVVMPDPFGLKDNTFLASGLVNISDRSALTRLDWQATVLSFLAVSVFTQVHYGKLGEFRLGFDVPAPPPDPNIPVTIPGAKLTEPVIDFGLGISLTF